MSFYHQKRKRGSKFVRYLTRATLLTLLIMMLGGLSLLDKKYHDNSPPRYHATQSLETVVRRETGAVIVIPASPNRLSNRASWPFAWWKHVEKASQKVLAAVRPKEYLTVGIHTNAIIGTNGRVLRQGWYAYEIRAAEGPDRCLDYYEVVDGWAYPYLRTVCLEGRRAEIETLAQGLFFSNIPAPYKSTQWVGGKELDLNMVTWGWFRSIQTGGRLDEITFFNTRLKEGSLRTLSLPEAFRQQIRAVSATYKPFIRVNQYHMFSGDALQWSFIYSPVTCFYAETIEEPVPGQEKPLRWTRFTGGRSFDEYVRWEGVYARQIGCIARDLNGKNVWDTTTVYNPASPYVRVDFTFRRIQQPNNDGRWTYSERPS
jgi:hypothetical protein